MKNEESKFSSIMTVKWEDNLLKFDKREVQLSRKGPPNIHKGAFHVKAYETSDFQSSSMKSSLDYTTSK